MSAAAFAYYNPGCAEPAQPDVPPNWKVDESLRLDLPKHLDHRVYCRIPLAPDRYAVRVDGLEPAVVDMDRQVPLKPEMAGRDKNRPRYSLRHGAELTPRGRVGLSCVTKVFLSRLVAEAVHGAPRRKTMEAHHGPDTNPLNNRWDNICWLTKAQHLALEMQRPGWHARVKHLKKAQDGELNHNKTLDFDDLVAFFKAWNRKKSQADLSQQFNISVSQVSRLLNGKSRAIEAGIACIAARIPVPRTISDAADAIRAARRKR
jgi:hypothetical protein